VVDKPADLRASPSGVEAQGVEVFSDVLSAPLYPGQLAGGCLRLSGVVAGCGQRARPSA
jgi:hypothetical protein